MRFKLFLVVILTTINVSLCQSLIDYNTELKEAFRKSKTLELKRLIIQCTESIEREGDSKQIIYLNQLGDYYWTVSQFIKADSIFKLSLIKLQKAGSVSEFDKPYLIKTLDYNVESNIFFGNYEKAQRLNILNQKLRKEWFKSDDFNQYKHILYDGTLQYYYGEYSTAKSSFNQIFELRKKYGNTKKLKKEIFTEAYFFLAKIALAEGDINLALKHIGKPVRTNDTDPSLMSLALNPYLAFLSKTKGLAKGIFQTNLDYLTSSNLYVQLLIMVDADADARIILNEQKNEINKFRHIKSVTIPYELNWARYYFLRKKYDKTVEKLEEVSQMIGKYVYDEFSTYNQKQREHVFKEYRKYLDEINFMLIQSQKSIPTASKVLFETQLNTKAFLLNKRLASMGDDPLLEGEFLVKQKRLEELRFQLVNSDKSEWQNISNSITNLDREISISSSTSKKQEYVRQEDVLGVLEGGEMLLETIRIEDFSWIKKPNQPQAFVKNGEITYVFIIGNPLREIKTITKHLSLKEEEDFLKAYRNFVKFRIEDTMSYSFIKEVDELLEEGATIYVSRDGMLYLTNIETFFDPVQQKYFLDKYNINYLNNLTDLLKKKEAPVEINHYVLLGNPHFNLTELNDEYTDLSNLRAFDQLSNVQQLPGTQKEINNIENMISSSQSFISLTGINATKQNLIKQDGDILHIATHGFFLDNNQDPLMNSGVILAGIINQNGEVNEQSVLTSFEISKLNFSAYEIVVLSACETGLGKISNGEGVYGLTRSFQVAGAKFVINSLWKVDDNVTSELMTLFYHNLKNTHNPKIALRQAQKSIYLKYKDPIYWGAFLCL